MAKAKPAVKKVKPSATKAKIAEPRKGARGRRPLDVDTFMIENLASEGKTLEQIAEAVGCSSATLRRRFAKFLDRGHATRMERLGRQAAQLAGFGCTDEEIAAVLDLDADTILQHFSESIKKGRIQMRASLRRMQFQTANGGNTTMQIWLGKQHLGQRDKMEMTGEELDAAIERELARVAAGGEGDIPEAPEGADGV